MGNHSKTVGQRRTCGGAQRDAVAAAHGPPQLDDGGGGKRLAAAGAAREHHDRRVGRLPDRLALPVRQLHLCRRCTPWKGQHQHGWGLNRGQWRPGALLDKWDAQLCTAQTLRTRGHRCGSRCNSLISPALLHNLVLSRCNDKECCTEGEHGYKGALVVPSLLFIQASTRAVPLACRAAGMGCRGCAATRVSVAATTWREQQHESSVTDTRLDFRRHGQCCCS